MEVYQDVPTSVDTKILAVADEGEQHTGCPVPLCGMDQLNNRESDRAMDKKRAKAQVWPMAACPLRPAA